MNIPKLRDYQQDLKNKAYKAIQDGNKSILSTLATGGGKTIIFSDIARDFIRNGKRGWILTHREEIRLQTVEKLYSFGLQPGQIASGRPMTTNSLQVASVQTLVNWLEQVTFVKSLHPDFIIVDECHHAIAPTWKRILDAFPKAIKLGYTATPCRGDGLGLNNIYQTMINGPQSAELVQNKHLTNPVIFSSKVALMMKDKKFKIKNDEFDLQEQTKFLKQKHIVKDTIDCYNQYFNGAPAIIFCASVADCDTVQEAMQEAGWTCGVVKSGMDTDLRKDCISGLGNGKYSAICSYEVIGEGVDVPVLAGVILRRLTRSLSIYLQQTGRALRLYPGKKHAIIIDQAGNYYIHGHPLEHQEWTLDGKGFKESTEPQIKSRECPNALCMAFIVDNPPQCPYCGIDLRNPQTTEETEIKIVNAELLQIQKPEFKPIEVKKQNFDILDDIVKSTVSKMDKDNNTLNSRFDFLINKMGKTKTNKLWEKLNEPR